MAEPAPVIYIVDDDEGLRQALFSLVRSVGLGAATFGILGLPGRMSHKPPVEIYSDRYMPGIGTQIMHSRHDPVADSETRTILGGLSGDSCKLYAERRWTSQRMYFPRI